MFSVFQKIREVTHQQMTQGLGCRECGRAIAASLTIGVFPILGFSTPMNTVSAALFRLNQPITQVFNWVVGPLKIALIFPFLRLGEWMFQAEPFSLSLAEFSERFFSDARNTAIEFAGTFAHAIAGWLLCAPLIYLLLFALTQLLITRRT